MKLLDVLHRWSGGVIGLLLALLGLSGAILVHRDAWVMLPHASDPQIQSTATIAAVTEKLFADPATRPQSLTFASANFGLDRLTTTGGGGAYTDQAGNLVLRWSSQWERPELWLFDFHHHLFAGDIGETVIGVAALIGLFFVISGTILWWRTRKTFAFRIWPARMSRPAIVRQHRDFGVVMAPLLALSLLTGATLVFRPLTALMFGPSAPVTIDRAMKAPKAPSGKLADRLNWHGLIGTARALYPQAEIRSLALPRRAGGTITLRMRKPDEWLPNGRTTLWFAADTGALIAHRDDSRLPQVVKAYNTIYPLHAAKVGGLAYRLLMTLSGLALAMLGSLAVWSFWFRRPKPARRRPVPAAASVS